MSYIFIITVLLSCGKPAEKEAFYLEEDYTGPAAIIFNQKNGVDEERGEDGTRIYRVPSTRVLYTKFQPVSGILKQKFFYTNSSKEKREIPSLFIPVLPTSKFDSTVTYAMRGIDGSFGDQEYFYFWIGKATKSDSLAGAGYKLMRRVMESYPQQIK